MGYMIELSDSIEKLPKIGPSYQKKLKKLGVETIQDLLFYFPQKYNDFSNVVAIAKAKVGDIICVHGRIADVKHRKSFKKWMDIVEIFIEDESGSIKALWFNQSYLADVLKEEDFVFLAGKVSLGKTGIYLSNPAYEKSEESTDKYHLTHTGRIIPVYAETRGLTSRWLRNTIKPLLAQFYKKIPDVLPKDLLKENNLLPLGRALWQIHFPDSLQLAKEAKQRFIFEDLFLLQLSVLKQKAEIAQKKSFTCKINENLIKSFVDSLPFKLTDSQKKCVWQILKDMEKITPMSRLLEGDVGSGKTVVATMAALNAASQGYQTAFMAPTEVLAKQHYKTITQLIPNSFSVGLLTSKEAKLNNQKIKKSELHKKIKEGKANIVIGTHALISKRVDFKNLALVVVDEQHKFGVSQRVALARGSNAEQTQNYTETKLLYDNLIYKIRGCLFKVKKTLGPGHKKIVYQKALEEELKNSDVKFSKEKKIPILYNKKKVGTYVPDFIINEKIIVELKALPFIGSNEKKQLWNYLKGSEYKLAILANFSPKELKIERIIYDPARDSAFVQQGSAFVPHLLSMTATPIPRTLALTIYGDLDVSLIKEMPQNRKIVKTFIVEPSKRQGAYDFIKKEVQKGKGVFVICPRIELRTKNQEEGIEQIDKRAKAWIDVKAVKQEYEKLSKEIFPDLKVAMLHGKVKGEEKEKTMNDFKNGKVDVLVSTSVVEVGVDVPRATVMMIEGAERFGLAQLHQFRGRVGRSEEQSYCFLFTTAQDQLNRKRLKAMTKLNNGFELAQVDLEIRGPGQLYGKQQWGLPDSAMEGLKDIFLVEKTREQARYLLEKNQTLSDYPLLKARVSRLESKVYFE